MPELPDVTLYLEALERTVKDRRLEKVRLFSPFVLRSVDPPIRELHDRDVVALRRLGKRIVLGFTDDLWLVIHLMIAGRLRWRAPGAKPPGKNGLAAFDFEAGCLLLTEASSKKRASLHVVRGEAGLHEHDRGGVEVLTCTEAEFAEALRRESHTLKRALTDPRLFSGIGNAYSDEILHAAQMSPVALTRRLDDEAVQRLFAATRETLETWTARHREKLGDAFPDKVTAFHPGMAVHGRYEKPCPRCGDPVQRIRYADNELNYCVTCQTGGKLLKDRSLSRLLKEDWPKTLEELEERK